MNTPRNKKERGQAIVLIALAIIGLVGMTALAVDGGNAFADRRQAQNAADNAAIAAALANVRNNPAWNDIGRNMASTNGYANPDQDVQIHTCANAPLGFECPSPYDGSTGEEDPQEYIHVVITSSVDTFFAQVLGIEQMTNRVEAIAHAKPPTAMFEGNAVVSVCTDGKSSISGASSNLIVDGGIFVNSSDGCPPGSFVATGSSDTTIPSVTVAGCANIDPGNIEDDSGTPITASAGEQQPYDFSYLDKLCDGASSTAYTQTSDTITPDDPSSPISITAGGGGFPPNGIEHLGAGIYCIDGDFKMTGNDNLEGTDVTFIMKSGGVNLNGGTITLSAPSTGNSAALLFYQSACGTNNTMKLNGGTDLTLTGSIIAPCVEVQVNGNANTDIIGQILGCTFTLNGSAGSKITYSDPLAIDNPPQIELTN